MYLENCKLISKEFLKSDIVKFEMESENLSKESKPGQFIEIRVNNSIIVPFLRRPISVHGINKEKKTIEIAFQIKGEGTKILSQKVVGDEIDVLGPLGNSYFDLKDYKKVAIVGGGIGVFPLLELAKQAKKSAEVNIFLGFRDKDLVILEDEFKKYDENLITATDNGSYGKNGFVVEHLREFLKSNKVDCIYACGRIPMLKTVKDISIENGIPAQISMEQLMACGVGACLGCTIQVQGNGEIINQRVCKEGPVFSADKVIF